MKSLHVFFKELWYNQPSIVIGGGVAILVLLGIYIWLLNKYQQYFSMKINSQGQSLFCSLEMTICFFIAYLIMAKGYWLINSNRSEVRRFTENRSSEDQFNKYVFVDSGKIVGVFGKEPPLLQRREEFKIEEAREIWEKLISQGWRRIEEVWSK